MLEVAQPIKNLVPYVTGKPIEETKREYGIKKVIKLASNENPLGASAKVKLAVKKAINEIHLYPDGACYDLKQAYAKTFRLKPENLVFGNGSDELMGLILQAYCQPGDFVVMFDLSFVAFKIHAQARCLNVHEIKLKDGFEYDMDALISFVENQWTPKHKVIYLPNPNNPTGVYVRKNDLDRLIKAVQARKDVLLVLDDAYMEFARAKDYAVASDYLSSTPNLLVLRTMSKAYGLGGLRVGILIGDGKVVEPINKVRVPFNLSNLAQVAAVAALKDQNHVKKSVKVAWQGIDFLYKELKKMDLPVWKSQGNFVLFDVKRPTGPVFESLLKKGLIVRPLKNYGLPTIIRLSSGTMAENRFALKMLKKVLSE